jgi:hypothetical protein
VTALFLVSCFVLLLGACLLILHGGDEQNLTSLVAGIGLLVGLAVGVGVGYYGAAGAETYALIAEIAKAL